MLPTGLARLMLTSGTANLAVEMKRVVIVGAGFAGLNVAKGLARIKEVAVTLLDGRNHHLFQPLPQNSFAGSALRPNIRPVQTKSRQVFPESIGIVRLRAPRPRHVVESPPGIRQRGRFATNR